MWAAAVIVWAGTHPAELCISFQVRKCKLYVRSSSSTWETSLKEEWVWVGFGWWGNKSYAQLTPPPSHPQVIFIFILLVLSLLSFIGSTSVLHIFTISIEGEAFPKWGVLQYSLRAGLWRDRSYSHPTFYSHFPSFQLFRHHYWSLLMLSTHKIVQTQSRDAKGNLNSTYTKLAPQKLAPNFLFFILNSHHVCLRKCHKACRIQVLLYRW